MSAVLAGVGLGLVAALVVLVDVKPWRRPPVRWVTVELRVDTEPFQQAMRAAADMAAAFARIGETVAQASSRMAEIGRVLWLDEYRRIRDLPAPADPSPFPRLRLWRGLP